MHLSSVRRFNLRWQIYKSSWFDKNYQRFVIQKLQLSFQYFCQDISNQDFLKITQKLPLKLNVHAKE